MAPATKAQATTKKFQKGERTVPAAGDKAQKYYSAEPDRQKKTVRQQVWESDGPICYQIGTSSLDNQMLERV